MSSDDKTGKKPTRTVSRRACLSCREKKIKCDGIQVCRNCAQLKIECVFVKSHRGGRRTLKNKSQAQPAPPPTLNNHQPHPPQLSGGGGGVLSEVHHHHHHHRLGGPRMAATVVSHEAGGAVQAHLQPQQQPQHYTPPVSSQMPAVVDIGPLVDSKPPQYTQLMASPTPHMSLEERLASLEAVVARLSKQSPQVFSEPWLPEWRLSESAFDTLFLPHHRIATKLVDLYFDTFHLTYPFLYPRTQFFRYLNLPTDIALVFAMFSVSCKFLDGFEWQGVHFPAYYKDQSYWIALAERHMDTLSATTHVKTLVILAHALHTPDSFAHAHRCVEDAKSVVKLHRLGERPATARKGDPAAENAALRGSTAQKLERESLVRTLWHVWTTDLYTSLWNSSDEKHFPAFDSEMALPVSNRLYRNALDGWDLRVLRWSDFETAMLKGPGSAEAHSAFYDINFTIAAQQLLLTAYKLYTDYHPDPIPQATRDSLEGRIRRLDEIIPREIEMDDNGCIVARTLIYLATITLHTPMCKQLICFEPNNGGHPEPTFRKGTYYSLRNIDHQIELHNNSDATTRQAYSLCVWGSLGLRRLLNAPPNGDDEDQLTMRHWIRMPDLYAIALEYALSYLGSECIIRHCNNSRSAYTGDQGDPSLRPEVLYHDFETCIKFLDVVASRNTHAISPRDRSYHILNLISNQLGTP
ncbi:hypothetical protein TRVA0_018S00430 [Trichomonascus vanleenenianus]|uniref:Zn(II)2Cys6 transcription factor n=1 Tax=Trichomonascus vanleenenianus TaxID=2268995 RepID=UPI003EC97017